MTEEDTIGRLVRRRRLESGYSLGQLAAKVGMTAAEVRAWERDVELPEHGILERLAETLELDLTDIEARVSAARAAAAAEPVAEPEPEEVDAMAEPPSGAESVEPESPPIFSSEPEDFDDGGFAVEDPFTPPAPPDDGAGEDFDFDLLDAPTEAVPVPAMAAAAAAARGTAPPPARPMPVVEPAPDSDAGLLRYLEPLRLLFDPHSRYLYWIRAGLTVVVLVIIGLVLLNKVGDLLDALSELIDTVKPAASTSDPLDALGRLSGLALG
jgi:transcriptional regulator with XRE-family HTH domain